MIESFGFSEFMFLVRSAGWTLLLTAIALVFGGLLGGLPINAIITKELRLIGSFRFDEEFALAVALMGSGAVDVTPVLTHTIPFEQAVEAFETANDRDRAMKVQLAFGELV